MERLGVGGGSGEIMFLKDTVPVVCRLGYSGLDGAPLVLSSHSSFLSSMEKETRSPSFEIEFFEC